MATLQLIVLIILVIIIVCSSKSEKKKDLANHKAKWVERDKEYNRKVLNIYGKNQYITKYGLEAYESIMNNKDTYKFFTK